MRPEALVDYCRLWSQVIGEPGEPRSREDASFDEAQATALVTEADADQDGVLNFLEFARLVRRACGVVAGEPVDAQQPSLEHCTDPSRM